MFLYIKIDFWHGRSGTVMAFIPDNISTHVHLLEDNDRIKKERWLLSAGVFSLADFPQNHQECFSENHYRFISVDSVGREKSKLFQVVVLILEAAITFFLFKLQRKQCACNVPLESLLITRKMHLYRHLSRFLGRLLDFSSV